MSAFLGGLGIGLENPELYSPTRFEILCSDHLEFEFGLYNQELGLTALTLPGRFPQFRSKVLNELGQRNRIFESHGEISSSDVVRPRSPLQRSSCASNTLKPVPVG